MRLHIWELGGMGSHKTSTVNVLFKTNIATWRTNMLFLDYKRAAPEIFNTNMPNSVEPVIELYIPLVPHLWLHTLGFRIVFLIVLLIGIFCDFSVFILQIVPTFSGVAGSAFWAMFVIQQTNMLMQPLTYTGYWLVVWTFFYFSIYWE